MRICLMKMPRTASNLLMRMFSDQPTVEPVGNPLDGYFFHSARGVEKKRVYEEGKSPETMTDDDRESTRDARVEASSSLQEYLERAADSGR